MKNLLNHIAKNHIKPELNHIYIHKDAEAIYAVATDSFRLLEIKLNDTLLIDNLADGYYTAKEWQALCSLVSKKKQDIQAITELCTALKAIQPNRIANFTYPDYKQIIPKAENIQDITTLADLKINADYFIDFIQAIPKDKFQSLYLNDIKLTSDKRMVVFINDNIKALLMLMNK